MFHVELFTTDESEIAPWSARASVAPRLCSAIQKSMM